MWDDPEAFDKAVDEYFTKEKVPTWTGLAIHLGFESRKSLHDYGQKPGFSYSVKKALVRIERRYEEAMMKQPAGAIFALKNFGWTDRQEVESHTTIKGHLDHRIDYSKLSEAALREIAALESEKSDENENFQNEEKSENQ
jgi:hypothetical protein